MADTGLTLVGTGVNIAGSGDDWSNPSNITATANYADSVMDKDGGLSDYLRGTNLGFSVPSGATIDGVEVQVNHEADDFNSSMTDEFVYLCENGSIISGCTNKASLTHWDNDPETFTYGGTSDTWNCSLSDTIVNSSTFGVQIMVQNNRGQTQWGRVYWIKITVYYTESGGSSNIKSIAGVVQARIKSITGVAEANIKSVAGVSN